MRLTADLVCQEAIGLMTDYLEGRLSRRSRRRFEKHMAGCPNCSEYLEQMRRTIEAAGRVQPADLEPEAREDLIELFRRYRDEAENL